MVDSVEVPVGRTVFLNVALWVMILGVLCAVAAGVLTMAGGSVGIIRPVAFGAMVCAVAAVAGAVLHSAQGMKAVFGIAAVAMLIAGSTFFGLTFSSS